MEKIFGLIETQNFNTTPFKVTSVGQIICLTFSRPIPKATLSKLKFWYEKNTKLC